MSGAASQIDSFSSSSSPLPHIFLLPHESFRSSSSSLPCNSQNNNDGIVQRGEDEIVSNPTNPWKKIDNGSPNNNKHMTDLMGTSWPALSHSVDNPFPLPHEVCTSALEKESGAKVIQTSSAHSISDITVTISKDNEREKFVSSSVVSSCAVLQDQVQKVVTEMESRTENSCENSSVTEKVNGFSANKHENEEPSKIIKTLPVSAGNGDKERQNSSDSSRTVPHFSTQRSFNTRLKQKPRSNQNQSNYSGFQNQKTSNRHQQPRSYNDRNSGWKHSNTQHVNSQNHIPGYINGFPLLHQPPSSPYAYSHFTPSTNPPPPANVPFLPIPYSIYPPTQYPAYVMPTGYYENSYVSGGQVHPQNSQINDFGGQDVSLYYAIRHQIEYYFSDENLANDFYLRNHMDAFGWVSVDVIAAFNKVKRMTKDVDLILRALQLSQVVEIQGKNIRKRINWKTWILPNSLLNKIQNIQLDLKSETKKMSVEPSEARRVSESSSEY